MDRPLIKCTYFLVVIKAQFECALQDVNERSNEVVLENIDKTKFSSITEDVNRNGSCPQNTHGLYNAKRFLM